MRSRYFLIPAVIALTVAAGNAGPAPSGVIEGKVTYTGTPPKMAPIDMAKEPYCQKLHNPPETAQKVATGPGNALEYVVVYISAGDQPGPAPTTPVRFDQKGCMYAPHVLPMEVGQPLQIYTDDPVAHNIHPQPKINSEWNKSQPPGASAIDTKWDKSGVHSGAVQYSSVDARIFRSPEDFPLRRDGQRRGVQLEGRAPGKVHNHGLAGAVRNAKPGRHHHRFGNQEHRFYL